MNIIDFIFSGGIIMIPLILSSIVVLTIIFERWFVFVKSTKFDRKILPQVKKLLKEDKIKEALEAAQAHQDLITHVVAIGIHSYSKSEQEKDRLISQASSRVVQGLEKNINILSVIANTAPLLGLLGTVTGMIKVFMKIQSMGGQVDIAMLAGGIGEALITTVTGLSIAIVSIFAYHYFDKKVDSISSLLKDIASELFLS